MPWVLATCTAVSILSTDLFAPSLPHLPEALGTDARTAQLAISVNLAAYALAQLVHGPLADRYGRRPLLSLALICFALISAVTALAPTIEMLVGGRFLQGLFSSVPSVVVVLIIRELYGGARAVSVMALYGIAVGVAPAVGPLIGGYLEVWFGWRAGFVMLAVLAAIIFVLVRRHVPEPVHVQRPLHLGAAAATYGRLLARRRYMAQLLPLSLVFGALFAFVATGPLVFIDLLNVPTERYGLCYAVIVVAFVAASIGTNRLSRQISGSVLMQTGGVVAALGGIALAVPILAGSLTIVGVLAAMAVFGAGLGLIMATGPVLLLDAVEDQPQGPASALLGSAQLGAAALAAFLSGTFYDGTALSMALTIGGFSLAGLIPLLTRPRG